MQPVILIPLPDPSALSYVERGALKNAAGDAYRAEHGSEEPVAVDVVEMVSGQE